LVHVEAERERARAGRREADGDRQRLAHGGRGHRREADVAVRRDAHLEPDVEGDAGLAGQRPGPLDERDELRKPHPRVRLRQPRGVDAAPREQHLGREPEAGRGLREVERVNGGEIVFFGESAHLWPEMTRGWHARASASRLPVATLVEEMSPPPFEIRNYAFDLGPEVPRHWHPAGRAVTRFLDNLSIFFPDGERFFMASVQAFAGAVQDDPELRAAVRAFCAQEGIHRREHRKYNDMLAAQGLPAEAMERRVERIIALVTARTPQRWHLGVTAALEHFTSLMGRQILERPELLEGAHETMAALWRWHAVEETEHKSVAYDVYLAAGGTYPERVFLMLGAALIFWAKVIEQQ